MNNYSLCEQDSELNIETVGTLNLKILRLERHLQLLNQQQLLSYPYPDHKIQLAQKACQVRFRLDRLIQHRENSIKSN